MYELDYKKPILYVIPIDSILGKLPVVPVGDTGTIPHRLRNHFPGAPGAPGGVRGRMQDVVCQFVGFGLVPRYVMKAIGVEGAMGYVELLLYQL